MKDGIVKQCLDILKREDIKYELRGLFEPVIEIIVSEINPYIYIVITIVFFIFVMISQVD